MSATRQRRPTMRDVAERAGVSVQTVSNFVNDRVNLMSEETRARVGSAMDALGYHPNISARGLRSAQTRTLAFMVLDPHPRFLADPLTNLVMAGVADVAQDRGYGMLLQSDRPGPRDAAFLSPVLESRVDGALLLMAGDESLRLWYVEQLLELNAEFVVFDQQVDNPNVSVVRAAERDSGRQLAAHLIEKGHRRIAFIAAGVPWAVVEERHRGYREALAEADIEPDPALELFEAGWEPSGGGELAKKLLELPEHPTAIMCGSDVLALGALSELKRQGVRVPEDIALTGFDDFMFSAHLDPPLTTVRVPAYDMGRVGASILIDRLNGESPAERQVLLPVELCLRDSA